MEHHIKCVLRNGRLTGRNRAVRRRKRPTDLSARRENGYGTCDDANRTSHALLLDDHALFFHLDDGAWQRYTFSLDHLQPNDRGINWRHCDLFYLLHRGKIAVYGGGQTIPALESDERGDSLLAWGNPVAPHPGELLRSGTLHVRVHRPSPLHFQFKRY